MGIVSGNARKPRATKEAKEGEVEAGSDDVLRITVTGDVVVIVAEGVVVRDDEKNRLFVADGVYDNDDVVVGGGTPFKPDCIVVLVIELLSTMFS